MFMTLLTAFGILLSRYTGSQDIAVGTPVANRNRAETEAMIGFFVNTLVLRTDLSGDPTVAGLLDRVRRTALDAYAHQDLPFEQLVETLVTERDRSRSPLFQVLFNYFLNDGDEAGNVPEGDPSVLLDDREAGTVARFDLRLIMTPVGGGLAGAIEYSTALFDAATVERIAGNLVALLTAMADGPQRSLSRLPVPAVPERDRLVHEWNDTTAPVPAARGVHDLIMQWARRTPDAVAVVCGGRALTYGALAARAGRLARYLAGAGVRTETVVGLCLPRGADMVVAILAVWQAGGAYLPLDPGYPADRLAFMLADSGASLLVGTEDLLGDLPVGRVRTLAVDDPVVRAALDTMPGTAPEVAVDPRQLAYVIYTSGSTGRPKGVQVPHGGVVNLVAAQGPVFGVAAGEPALQYASFSFDAAVSEMCVALGRGATLVVAGADERAEPVAVARLLRSRGVRVATLPPSLLALLTPGDLDGLGTLVVAGERLEPELADRWRRHHRLINAYGPTEITVCASIGAVEGGGIPPIGAPIANSRAYVLDAALNPVPIGAVGELYLGGAGTARGYGGRPALTAERFVADPYTGDGSRMYRSGDRARWRPDGQLEFVSRADEQIKVRGFRVEPGEIEAVLGAHPAVAAAVVAAHRDETDLRLVAYLVPDDPAEGLPDAGELRAFAGRRLPAYMIPAVFVELASVPLTPNGKVDRKALPAPGEARVRSAVAYAAPRTELERTVAEIYAQLLGLDRVGIDDGFFDLGGHSLLATQLVFRIREEYDAELPLEDLFNRPTVRQVAEAVSKARFGVENTEDYEEFEL
jgi:amino acid adenylation domain-containing protein